MNWKAVLLPVGLLALLVARVNPAIARDLSIFQSTSGDTIFPENAIGCAGDVVHYSTRYHSKAYQGTMQVKSPNNPHCDGGRWRLVSGNFEERSQDGTERCMSQLALYLTLDPRGGSSAQWNHIQAVPGYRCAGIGTAPKLSLVYKSGHNK